MWWPLLVFALLSVLRSGDAHQFQTFDNGQISPIGNLEHLVRSLQKEVTDIRKEVHTRMDTMKYELTCEIRNMKEALSKEREEMSAKVDQVALEMTDFKKKLKRGLRRVGTQNDDIKGELRSQKAELFAVRNSVYDSREEVLEKSGLKALHALTSGRPHQLRADMEDWEGNTAWAAYTFFAVSGEEDKYRLRIAGYTGTAGDSMRHSHHQMFSTVDQDNDQENWGSCARGRGGGGWWWGRCACTQPTGQYRRGRYQGPERGITWWHWKDSNYSLKTLLLKIRPLE
nr:angiopoietin-2-like [Cherax quadricarinatus]